MAELGHPVIGPQSYWKLTPGEVRIYAEGMQVESERQEEEAAYTQASGGAPSYDRRSKKRRDNEALQSVDQKVQEQRSN